MLSGGQQQRVAMARSVVTEPRALLLDEPFSNLDATMRGQTREYIRSVIKRLNMTSVLVTHDHEEAMEFADCVYVLSGGEVVERGSPRELYQRPTTRRASAALGYANLLDIDRCERARDGTVAVHVPGLPAPLVVRPSDADHQKILDERIAGRMAASLLIRPEDIVLLPPGSAAQGEENVAAGVVEGAFFVGRGSIYNVRIDDTLSLGVESREDYAASDRVDIRLPANCLVPVA
jgi:ABC-type Fe3+/spermidine/putrescine transport system ATPase subunit